jgi:type II secretory pathway pseudopilin PulG
MIEVIAVLAVVGVLAAVGAVAMNSGGADLGTEAAALRSNLRYAQTRAMADTSVVWSVEITETGYSLLCDGVISDRTWPAEDSATHTFPDGSVQASGDLGTITYNSWGNPGADDTVITLTEGTDTVSVTVVAVTGFIP